MRKYTLPMPLWHGSESNLLSFYIKFLEQHYERYGNQPIKDLTDRIEVLRRNIDVSKANYAQYEAKMNRRAAKIQDLTKQLVTFTDNQLAEAYQALIAVPEVIGTGIDKEGALTVYLRPEINGYAAGIFECDFQIPTDSHLLSSVPLRRVQNSTDEQASVTDVASPIQYASFPDMVCNVKLPLSNSYATHMRTGRVKEAISELLGYFVGPDDYHQLHAEHHITPDHWSSQTNAPFPIKALRKRLDICINSTTRTDIRQLIVAQSDDENIQKNTVQYLRSFQADLRRTELKLERLKATVKPSDYTIDTQWAADQLRRITTKIPGVMGIRFSQNGAMVVHVRTSVVHKNKRYDFGDYELQMTLGSHIDGVVNISQTRSPSRSFENHFEPPYWIGGYYFCFGERREELYRLFIEGNFAHFINIALNSMNSVNDDDAEGIPFRNFPEIPLDEVWINRPRNRARRIPTHK